MRRRAALRRRRRGAGLEARPKLRERAMRAKRARAARCFALGFFRRFFPLARRLRGFSSSI